MSTLRLTSEDDNKSAYDYDGDQASLRQVKGAGIASCSTSIIVHSSWRPIIAAVVHVRGLARS